ncbi:hypothetical protein AAFC00_000357 [Neodothiora populina]|uniref:RNA polymerase II subunit B1 CTD phosphatase RPAP2 homolog n=1 Tax=Neodothiora populina TaxID=2781224 RepID=A0ABR3PCL6_9PEZI
MTSSTQPQPKSILKKTQLPLPDVSPNIPKPTSDVEKRRLAIAVEQARLIQEQKDVLATVLNSIEELSDYPAASSPTDQEIQRFLTLVMQFQPSDYDALIEERHVNGRCGYTLCAAPPRATDRNRPWLRAKGSENWCTDACAKRALYIRAQLDETPAWERRGGIGPAIVLYDERKLAASATAKAASDQRRTEQRNLALERGEGKVAAFKIEGVMITEILEKTTTGSDAKPPFLTPAENEVHNLIEGYQTKGTTVANGVKLDDDEDDDEEDTDLLPFCPPRYQHLG